MNQQQRDDLLKQLDDLERAMDEVWEAETLQDALERHRETLERMKWIRLQIAASNHAQSKH